LNPENKPVLRIKKHTFNLETELNEEVRERLSKYINEFREIWISDRNELIDHLTGDGYEHIAEFLIEFTENDGILHTQLTKINTHRDSSECDRFEYNIVCDTILVLPDGTLQKSDPRLELIRKNWY
jgi:hypothetical protein